MQQVVGTPKPICPKSANGNSYVFQSGVKPVLYSGSQKRCRSSRMSFMHAVSSPVPLSRSVPGSGVVLPWFRTAAWICFLARCIAMFIELT